MSSNPFFIKALGSRERKRDDDEPEKVSDSKKDKKDKKIKKDKGTKKDKETKKEKPKSPRDNKDVKPSTSSKFKILRPLNSGIKINEKDLVHFNDNESYWMMKRFNKSDFLAGVSTDRGSGIVSKSDEIKSEKKEKKEKKTTSSSSSSKSSSSSSSESSSSSSSSSNRKSKSKSQDNSKSKSQGKSKDNSGSWVNPGKSQESIDFEKEINGPKYWTKVLKYSFDNCDELYESRKYFNDITIANNLSLIYQFGIKKYDLSQALTYPEITKLGGKLIKGSKSMKPLMIKKGVASLTKARFAYDQIEGMRNPGTLNDKIKKISSKEDLDTVRKQFFKKLKLDDDDKGKLAFKLFCCYNNRKDFEVVDYSKFSFEDFIEVFEEVDRGIEKLL